MNITPIIVALISAAIGGGVAWNLQGRTIDSLKLETANERIAVARANRITVERATLKLAEAQAKYAASVENTRTERRTADATAVGLRNDTAAAVRDAGTSTEACARQVASLAVVFDQCSGAVVDMAEHAQGWYVEAVRQHEAP